MKLFSFLKRLTGIRNPLRPPGAVDESTFVDKCIRCGKCEEVCPFDSIQLADLVYGKAAGTPVIIPRNEPCWLCEDLPCVEVCPTEALQPVSDRAEIKMGVAWLDTSTCFAYNGILCRACYERCPLYGEAITLEQELYPIVHEDICVGCGICEKVCPVEPTAIIVASTHGLAL